MSNITWRKRFSIWLNRLYLYPPVEPMQRTGQFWFALGIVAFAALLFSGYFIFYLTGLQNAYQTNAEDLGIIDQALWTLLHGQLFHQTICNILTDTNCYSPAGISRFAIHFEPVLFLVAPEYALFPDPKFLQVLQVLVVASGAFPAFLLARLRLRNEWPAIAIALLYLLYPAQQAATVDDFHAVTLTAAFLLFMLYFLYTRRPIWLLVFAVLAMACKEEVPVIVALCALWSMIFQRWWRIGLALLLLACLWIGVEFLIIHLFSPTGQHLLAGRWSYLGSSPVQIMLNLVRHPVATIKNYVLETHHILYLRSLLAPTGYLALLAPWILILAAPPLALNLLSSDPQMYSGLFQYDAEMVPILIFATIEALVLLLWLAQMIIVRVQQVSTRPVQDKPLTQYVPNLTHSVPRTIAYYSLMGLTLVYMLFSVVRSDYYRGGNMPFTQGFLWPQETAHTKLAQHFIDMIPPTASVSAQSALVPHISHRSSIYLFPYADTQADYIFLDVSSDIYPYVSTYDYVREAKSLLLGNHYGIQAAQDGYLLLKKGLPSPGVSTASAVPDTPDNTFFVIPNISESFCSYVEAQPDDITHPVRVDFASPDSAAQSISLVGYDLDAPDPLSASGDSLVVTTYWKMNSPISTPLQVLAIIVDKDDQQHLVTSDFPAAVWCQSHTWQTGQIMRLSSRLFTIQSSGIPTGLAHLSIALAPLLQPFSTITDERFRLPVHVVQATGSVKATQGANAVQLAPLTILA